MGEISAQGIDCENEKVRFFPEFQIAELFGRYFVHETTSWILPLKVSFDN